MTKMTLTRSSLRFVVSSNSFFASCSESSLHVLIMQQTFHKVISGGSNVKTEVFDEPSGALGAIQSARLLAIAVHSFLI